MALGEVGPSWKPQASSWAGHYSGDPKHYPISKKPSEAPTENKAQVVQAAC